MFELPKLDTPPIKKALSYGKLLVDMIVYVMLITIVEFAQWYFEAWPEVLTGSNDD